MTTQNEITIKLESLFSSSHLSFRHTADTLFDEIECLEAKKVIVDFKNIQTVSRSFAHQYLLRKKQSRKIISEMNKSKELEKMFKIVATSKTHTAEDFTEDVKVASLPAALLH